MRSPLRWKLRTLMAVVAVAGIIFAAVVMVRRSAKYREIAREYTFGEGVVASMIEALDGLIRADRMMVEVRGRVPSDQDKNGIYADSPTFLERHLRTRSKFAELREDFRRKASDYRRVSYRPWAMIRGVEKATFRTEGVHRYDQLVLEFTREQSAYETNYHGLSDRSVIHP